MPEFSELITPDGYIKRAELIALRDRILIEAREAGRTVSEPKAWRRAWQIAADLYRAYYGKAVPEETEERVVA